MMRRLARLIATAGGVGYVPIAPGTAGSLIGCLLAWWWPWPGTSPISVIAMAAAAWLGALASTAAEQDLQRHDPPCIVIDEVVAMWMTILLRPFALPPGRNTDPVEALLYGIVSPLAFLLFRLFDIVKPPPLKRLAQLPGGWGVMADDLGAALYTLLVLWSAWLAIAVASGSLIWWYIHR